MIDTGQNFRDEIPKGYQMTVTRGDVRVHYDSMPGVTIAPELLLKIARKEITIEITYDLSGGYAQNGVIFREVHNVKELKPYGH